MKAIEVAKELAEIDADAKINLKQYPRPKTTTEQLEDILGGSVQMNDNLTQIGEIINLPEVQAAIKARQRMQVGQELEATIDELK